MFTFLRFREIILLVGRVIITARFDGGPPCALSILCCFFSIWLTVTDKDEIVELSWLNISRVLVNMSWVSFETAEDEDREEEEEECDVFGFLLTVWLVDEERPFCPEDPDVDFEDELFEVSFEVTWLTDTSLGCSDDVEAVSLEAALVEGLFSAIWLMMSPTTS